MESNNEDLFRLTEENLSKIRYIKLDKKASYSERELEETESSDGNNSEVPGIFETIKFYSLGFYDVLTCIKKRINTSFTNKEHFLISYPFKKSRATLRVEQWFGILPLASEKIYSNVLANGEKADPFFCNSSLHGEMPFVGVVLISLGGTFSNALLDFKGLLNRYINIIEGIFNEDYNKYLYIAEIYYSLNCSDLCLVIRTNGLPFIHFINSSLNKKAIDEIIEVNTTVIFSVQNNATMEILDNVASVNNDVKFIVRSNLLYPGTKSIRSYGVNGIGRYVTEFGYKKYIEYLPELINYKVNNINIKDRFIKSICHEREWFNSRSDIGIYKNPKFQAMVHKWINSIYDKISDIEKLAKNIFLHDKISANMYNEMFIQEFSFIKDLVYTYSDLWYQKASVSGFAFFSQIYIALYGISFMLEKIREISTSGKNVGESVEELLKVIHDITFDLNGYNKQFQHLNQDSVNYPSYEIQSKVNAEKYMSAYCSFLHKFFALYYEEKDKSENIVQTFPLALVDINQREIIAKLFFRNTYNVFTKEDNDKEYRRGLFSVHFPSSRYFSDLWISLPLLMHEVSHTQHYGLTVKRNLAVIYNIDKYFSEEITKQMLIFINNGEYSNSSKFLCNEISKKIVYEAIKGTFTVYNNDKVKSNEYLEYGYTKLIDYYIGFYFSVFNDYNEITEYSHIMITNAKVKEEFDFVMELIGFEKMCFPYVGKVSGLSAFQYLVNVLYLEFHYDFYKKYKHEYDNAFVEELKNDMYKCKDKFEKEMYGKVLNFFEKNVKYNLTETDDSYIYIAFSVIMIAGMGAVFEKYKNEFGSYGNTEDFNYTYYKKLLPNIYTFSIQQYVEILSETYLNYIVEDKQNTEHEKNIMNNMLMEYYQLFVCIKDIMHFIYNKGSIDNKELNMTDVFLEKIHEKSITYINSIEKSESLKIIFSESNREQMMQLGFFEEDNTIIKELFTKVFTGWKYKFIADKTRDRSYLFQEVYADCGMCKAMGFDAFGYCMFAVSIHNIVGDLSAVNTVSNFLADRLRSVLQIYFVNMDDDKGILASFCAKLFDFKMVNSICDMLYTAKKDASIEKFRELLAEPNIQNLLNQNFDSIGKEDFRKWERIINQLLIIIDKEYSDDINGIINIDKIIIARSYLYKVNSILNIFIQQDIWLHIPINKFNGYFKYLSNNMEGKKWIETVRNDVCIKEIGQFYNVDFPEGGLNKFEWYYKLYSNGFIKQCNFIFDNYCEYRSAFGNILNKVNNSKDDDYLEIGKWFDILDNYYIKKE